VTGVDDLRQVVREVLAEVLPGLAKGTGAQAWTVRLSSDAELHDFVLRVLRLADDPKVRGDLISGRTRFRLTPRSEDEASPDNDAVTTRPVHRVDKDAVTKRPVRRVDKGAVTERAVAAAAKAGAAMVLGPRAVLTPLARDKARTLGVPIEKEC
jgi:hypothetical protein